MNVIYNTENKIVYIMAAYRHKFQLNTLDLTDEFLKKKKLKKEDKLIEANKEWNNKTISNDTISV